ncbi:MAG: hypothetical protein ACRCY4_04635, partial [Brevinema sp.]
MKILLILFLLTSCAKRPAVEAQSVIATPSLGDSKDAGHMSPEVIIAEIEKGNFTVLDRFFETNQLFAIQSSNNLFISNTPLYFTNKYGIKFINSDSLVFDSNQLISASNIQESFKYKFLLIQREIHQDIPSANELIKRAIELQDYDNFELNDIPENDLLIIYLMYTEAELLRGYLLENILT